MSTRTPFLHLVVLIPALSAVLSLFPVKSFCGEVADEKGSPAFAALDFEAAKAKSVESKKLFIVDTMAAWCGPCKEMDKTTWRDPAVLSWLASRAVVIQIDVDKEEELALALKIEAMPTVVVFRDGKEFDRIVGFQNASEFLSWLEGVDRGESRLKTLEAGLEKAKGKGEAEVKARLEIARAAAGAGEFARSAEEYCWLWDNSISADPAFRGVRLSYMVDDMRQLAEKAPEAVDRFKKMRDKLVPAIEAFKFDREQFADWLALCNVIGEEDSIITWYEKVKAKSEAKPALAKVSADLADVLASKGKWAEAGSVLADPVEYVRSTLVMSKTMVKEPDFIEMVLSSVGPRYAMTLAAGRSSEGDTIAKEVVDNLGTGLDIRVGLIKYSLEVGATAPIHEKWLSEAASAGMDVADLRSLNEQIRLASSTKKQ